MRGKRQSIDQSVRRTIAIDGVPVHYRETTTDGPALILIHGLSGSTRWWSRNLAPLAECCHVYAIDLPGFGDNRRWDRFHLSDAPTHLCAWMDALGISRAHIVGHSMGGVIATDFARRNPERIDRLILVDAPIVPDARGWFRLGVESAALARRLPLGFVPVLMADAFRAGLFTLSRASRAVRQMNLAPHLDVIAAPTLVIWGEHDRMFRPDYGKQVAEAFPDALFTVVKGAGHNPMWDRPDSFNRLVLSFLISADSPHSIG